ncbi:hypothetical protein CY34DRAFT_103917 [Suillus luteus UH-Slu-Lm8-n1]|uniref:Unplaced genomic scaffold CY34scaffold_5, whole genome shotgun sequence n=1 Tax=Suillus luteus UH-Slu-Lm8-n1 TaxID=930992 RepID=A0A0D0B3Z5_9AGAM|nr:hypothetical protein CY34DRAFT_103917 [Suillus luteus UH-Slu-Lm8-n1]
MTANAQQKGTYHARQLHAWTQAFIVDCDDLPFDAYGRSKISKLDDKELANKLHIHLQSVGKYVKAGDLVTYLSNKDIQGRFGLKTSISLAMAKCWMHKLRYHWHSDYHDQMKARSMQMTGIIQGGNMLTQVLILVQRIEAGADLWMGKRAQEWFFNDNMLKQVTKVMDILENNYLGSDHVLVFDNASMHLKRADGALSTHYMPKGIWEWGVETMLLGEDGKSVHGQDGKVLKTKLYPPTKKDDQMEANVHKALDSVPTECMHHILKELDDEQIA